MAAKNRKPVPHICPKIRPDWNVNVTGPAYVDGESVSSANAKWAAYKRLVALCVKPMPRRTH